MEVESKEIDKECRDEKSVSHEAVSKSFWSIPGPWPSLPLIGTEWYHFYRSLTGRNDLSKLHEVYIKKYHQYGPIFKEEYRWRQPIVHIFDPNDFEIIFKAQGRCPIRPPNEFVSCFRASKPERYANIGLANMNGLEWYKQRQRLVPATMRLKTINENMHNQNEICEDFINLLDQRRDSVTGRVDNIQDITYRLALESICMLCLDCRIGALVNVSDDDVSKVSNNNGRKLIESTKLLFDTFNELYYGFPFWKLWPTNAWNNLVKAETEIYEIASEYVDEAIRNLNDRDPNERQTVLETLLKTENLSIDEIKITIIDLIIGGIFTVSNSFAFLIYHLAAHPDVQHKILDEMRSISPFSDHLDEFESNLFSMEFINQMSYLKACVQECFRLNCPVPGIMRTTSKSIVLSGYEIPENTTVFSHFMATCRLEKYFQQPNRFRPERWIDPDEKATIHPFSLLPFGYGNRLCLGKRFTESEIYLTTVKLLKRFHLKLCEEFETTGGSEKELELKHCFIVIPANPISIYLSPRNL
ncbi:Ecdysone 20-monooxygenase [Sarcoptes scabiei]|uniref:Ecdysone 20-monooxygenase n=1 Tax=Sarcoptes scabiei TaxID=52283 RepID=A0A834RC70_SARSC|nr:Ecdysone 20-monooxygenase [Sarcoptes scabiei]UXI21282.1 Cubilin [Sarcoptes scabiei]